MPMRPALEPMLITKQILFNNRRQPCLWWPIRIRMPSLTAWNGGWTLEALKVSQNRFRLIINSEILSVIFSYQSDFKKIKETSKKFLTQIFYNRPWRTLVMESLLFWFSVFWMVQIAIHFQWGYIESLFFWIVWLFCHLVVTLKRKCRKKRTWRRLYDKEKFSNIFQNWIVP